MSRVFLAEDTELEREVAIKVLSPDLVDDTLLARFRQEVLQTARLQHPTIVPLLGAGTLSDEQGREIPYYVMQYVRGESLRSRLLHEGQLSVSLTVKILRSMLDALVHAHAHDVVHRDIKPENVFMSGTSVVLADFGIAKVATRAARASITSPGTAVGTPTYMAPEQLAGDDATTAQSDLYAVGVVAYEMLAGRLPWGGTTISQVLVSKATGRIVPLRSIRPDVPVTLESAIAKCLSLDRAKRPPSAIALLGLVEAIGVTPTTPPFVQTGSRPSTRLFAWRPRRRSLIAAASFVGTVALAVIGWRTLGAPRARTGPVQLAVLVPHLADSTGADSTLSEQLYHSLISSLRPVSGLTMRGEVSVPALTQRGLTTRQIAESLHVDSMLAIDVHAATGGSYLLSVELRRAHVNQHDVVAGPISLQSLAGLTPDSAQTLAKLLSGEVVARLGLVSTNRELPTTRLIDAWVAWSKGRDEYAKRTPVAMRAAAGYFARAVALDSTYSQAHADLATAYVGALFYHYRLDAPPYALAARALRLADQSVVLQPGLGDGYLARAYLGGNAGAPLTYLQENYGSELRLKSTNPNSQLWNLNLLSAQGRYQEALPRLKEQVVVDPQSPAARIAVSLYALPSREYVTAVREASNARALHPGLPFPVELELWGRVLLGGAALNECANVPAGPFLGARAVCLERTGRSKEARSVIDSLFRVVTDKAPMDSTFDASLYVGEMAMYYAARGEWSSARQWLRQAFAESPSAIDERVMHSGVFNRELELLSDTLRAEAWKRIVLDAQRPGSAKN
jgi:serine/threonine-protein kinase